MVARGDTLREYLLTIPTKLSQIWHPSTSSDSQKILFSLYMLMMRHMWKIMCVLQCSGNLGSRIWTDKVASLCWARSATSPQAASWPDSSGCNHAPQEYSFSKKRLKFFLISTCTDENNKHSTLFFWWPMLAYNLFAGKVHKQSNEGYSLIQKPELIHNISGEQGLQPLLGSEQDRPNCKWSNTEKTPITNFRALI